MTQWQTDIPRKVIVRQFDIQCGYCKDCGAKVRGRHELQTSDAVGAAASQLGPSAHAAIAVLNKEVGLTHGKITRLMKILFGLKVGRATSCRSMLRTAKKCEPAYAQIVEEVRGAPLVKIDETGWRVNGLGHWLHVFVTDFTVLYRLDRRRGHEVPAEILGLDYDGTMVHDGLASYGRFLDAIHQQCNFHLLTRCRELMEIAQGYAACFPLQAKGLLLQGLSIRDRFLSKEITDQGLAILRGKLLSAFGKLLNARVLHTGNARLRKFLINHRDEIFWYLECPAAIPATSNESESELRPNVIARKLSGGNRSNSGRQAQQILPSITHTCHKLSLDAFEWIKQLLCRMSPTAPLHLRLGKQVRYSINHTTSGPTQNQLLLELCDRLEYETSGDGRLDTL